MTRARRNGWWSICCWPPGAAWGGMSSSWFTGRTVEVDQVVGWVRSGRRVCMCHGSAGTGKTAIAGRVVSLSNPVEREQVLADGRAMGTPTRGAVGDGARARPGADRGSGRRLDRRSAGAGGGADRATGPAERRRGGRAGAARGGESAAVPVIVVDGLDEARSHAFTIAQDLLMRLAPYAVVIVSTRELRRGEAEPSLLDVLTVGTAELDLDDPTAQQRGRADMRAYIAGRLGGMDRGSTRVRSLVSSRGGTSMTDGSPFLLARLVTDQLRSSPVDTSRSGWHHQVSHSIEDAFDADLAGRGPGRPGDCCRPLAPRVPARVLLGALTWGLGAGLPGGWPAPTPSGMAGLAVTT